jgi:hypothetical protein
MLCDSDLRDSNLSGCDLRGSDLRDCNLSDSDLSDSDLRDSDLRIANLYSSDLRGSNLRGSNLSDSDLRDCNLSDSDLRDCDLSDSDLRGAIGLPVAPVVQRIDAAILAALEAGGRLVMNSWHTCATTHCRAGWAITLAGDAGRKLEAQTTSYLAGRLIYEASRPGVPCPDFYAENDKALADIRRCAAEQTKDDQ